MPLVLIGLLAHPVAALVLLAAAGVGNVLFDMASVTLLQRSTSRAALPHAFGAVESVVVLGLGLGAGAAAPLASALGLRGALVLVGALLPALAVAALPLLARTDDEVRLPERQIGVLRAVPLFDGLSGAALEGLAFAARTVRVPQGRAIVRQGDVGDTYYAIVTGEVAVTRDGRELGALGPGEGFGEIALLRDVPRTATVSAVGDVELLAIDRPRFLATMSADPAAAASAETLVAARLAEDVAR